MPTTTMSDFSYRPEAVTSRSVFDPASQATLRVATPDSNPDLWRSYLNGAQRSYASHGVDVALDYETVLCGTSTTLFFAAVDRFGTVVGGVRAQGPYISEDESHALVEWRQSPALGQVRDAISSRIADGVVEMKSAWVGPTSENPSAVSAALSRMALPTMAITGARYVMATAADHVLRRWESGGGLVSSDIEPAAYPDARYRTRIMWWDRRTLIDRVSSDVGDRILRESAELSGIGGVLVV